jgi:nucleotide-binding universal stress UspA family protein
MSTALDTRRTDEAPRVVAGVDDSGSARAALHWAVGWARHTGARVVAITAWAPHLPVVTGPEIGATTVAARVLTDEQLQAQAQQWLADAIATLPDGAGQVLDCQVVRGDVARVLLDAADKAAPGGGQHETGGMGQCHYRIARAPMRIPRPLPGRTGP